MCVVSMVMDHYNDKFYRQWPNLQPMASTFSGPTRAEFDQLRKDVDEMLVLLRKAKQYDERTNQPDCEDAEKLTLLRQVAKFVGVDLDKALASQPPTP